MFTVSRPIHGISLNGYEYLLDDNGTPKVFATPELAVMFLQANGYGNKTEKEIHEIFNITMVEVHGDN